MMGGMGMEFNTESAKPRFIYKRNPLVEKAFQIFQINKTEEYDLVGEYVLVDESEDLDLTEKNVMNLITVLNGRQNLIDLSNLTTNRLLYNIVEENAGDGSEVKIMLRTHDGKGVSKENALITIKKGVFYDN